MTNFQIFVLTTPTLTLSLPCCYNTVINETPFLFSLQTFKFHWRYVCLVWCVCVCLCVTEINNDFVERVCKNEETCKCVISSGKISKKTIPSSICVHFFDLRLVLLVVAAFPVQRVYVDVKKEAVSLTDRCFLFSGDFSW